MSENKRQKIVVIGGGGHAKSVISILKKIKEFEIIGYVDISGRGRVLGIPYLGKDNILGKLFKGGCQSAVMGIGNVVITAKRSEMLEKIEKLGYKLPSIVSPSAIVNEDVKIKAGTVVLDRVVLCSGVRVGKGVILNTGSLIDHDCSIGDFVHVAPGAVLSGGVKIGAGSILGIGCRIIQDVTVEKNCLIAAGAVVVKDCRKLGTYMGVPAKLVEK